MMKLLKGFDQQEVEGKPDRPAPIGIATKQATARLSWLISDRILLAIGIVDVGMLGMEFTDGTDAVIAQKLLWIKHALEQAFHAMTTHQCQQAAFCHPRFLPA